MPKVDPSNYFPIGSRVRCKHSAAHFAHGVVHAYSGKDIIVHPVGDQVKLIGTSVRREEKQEFCEHCDVNAIRTFSAQVEEYLVTPNWNVVYFENAQTYEYRDTSHREKGWGLELFDENFREDPGLMRAMTFENARELREDEEGYEPPDERFYRRGGY